MEALEGVGEGTLGGVEVFELFKSSALDKIVSVNHTTSQNGLHCKQKQKWHLHLKSGFHLQTHL